MIPAPRADTAPGREAAVETFLAGAGWGRAERRALAGDASPRRYERLVLEGRRAVLMDAEPARNGGLAPFLAVTAWLRAAGFSAPAVIAAEPAEGLLLLEDLGDDLYARVLARGEADEGSLYAAATDLLAALHRLPPPAPGPDWAPAPYDVTEYLREARLVVEWYLPAAPGGTGHGAELEAVLAELLAAIEPERPVAVLRDYHAENLLWLPRRRGLRRVGLIDYQDLVVGHPAYDLVSLLEDARRDTSADLRAAMIGRFLAQTGLDPDCFTRAAHVLAAQRNLKILGIFARLCRRDGKPRYLAHIPRVWAHLQRDLSHPALAPLRAWARYLPPPEPAVLARIAAAGPA